MADADVFAEMERAAVRLAQLVGYVSAGTVEYLYDAEKKSFHFLELNPRLQVEHPCSEMVSGVNLPAAQLQIAMGVPLQRIVDIRLLYGKSKYGSDTIDFVNPDVCPRPRGHVLACRITAENPDEGFKPSGGTVQELTFRSAVDVWGYFSVSAAGGLHEFADSQFGHCFAWGKTRDSARNSMVLALKELSIRADFRTTAEFLVDLLERAEFRQQLFTTEWLDSLIKQHVKADQLDPMMAVTCGAVQIADTEIAKACAEFQQALSRGQVLSTDILDSERSLDLIYNNTRYKPRVVRMGETSYALIMNDSYLEVRTSWRERGKGCREEWCGVEHCA